MTPTSPAAQTLNIASNGGAVPFSVARVSTADGRSWLSVSPQGVSSTPSALTVRASVGTLTRGAYTGEIQLQPTDATIQAVTVPVTFLVGDQVPFSTRNQITNGASYITGVVVSGSIFSVFGENLAPGTDNTASVPLPTSRLGVAVRINGRRAPLFLVSPTQINGVVPDGLTVGPATLRVEGNGTVSPPINIDIAPTLPGIFTYPNTRDHPERGLPT
jgi:hypothetical protein